MVVKRGRFGKFLACSRYPECNHTQGMSTGVACPRRRHDRGAALPLRQDVLLLRELPQLQVRVWYKPVPRACPQCGAPFLTEKFSKKTGPYIACYKKECGYKEVPVTAGQGAEGPGQEIDPDL